MFWTKRNYGVIQVGFTESGLKQLGQIWNLLPKFKEGDRIIVNTPIFTAEVTSGLRVIRCPESGIVSFANYKAFNYPEKITANTDLLHLKESVT